MDGLVNGLESNLLVDYAEMKHAMKKTNNKFIDYGVL